MSIIWHNGDFKDDGPVFSSNDRMRLGEGVFDTMLALDGVPVMAEEHHDRLQRHAQIMGLNAAYKINGLKDFLVETLRRNHLDKGQAVLTTIVTGGPADRGLKTTESQDIQIIIRAAKAPKSRDHLRLIISKKTRRNEGSPLSRIKSINYGDHIIAANEAAQHGSDDAIMLNNQDQVTCATIGNIFICQDGMLITPRLDDGVVDGIFRAKILQHFDVTERSITQHDLLNSNGIYVTNTVRGAIPVSSVDGNDVPHPTFIIPRDFHL